ncbi:MAG: hypothetical protein ABSH01_02050 [Terriglobia bacterium]|jgi:hypothetical protein
MATGHLREGAWINASTGEWRFIDEHSDWARRPGNLASIGLSDVVREHIRDIPNDYSGENRRRILLTVMADGGIRLRGHGDWVAIEFTIDTASALLACRDVLRNIAGEFTLCRFSNLGTSESLELFYRDYEQHIERDIEWILRLAAPFRRNLAGA